MNSFTPTLRPSFRPTLEGGGDFSWSGYPAIYRYDPSQEGGALATGGGDAVQFETVATIPSFGATGDATQTTASLQGKFLTVADGNFLYCPRILDEYGQFDTNLLPTNADFDATAVFAVEALTGHPYCIFSQYKDAPDGRITVEILSYKARIYIGGVNALTLTGTTNLVSGQVHTIRVTRVGDLFSLYLDGALEASGSRSGVINGGETDLGWQWSAVSRAHRGAIYSFFCTTDDGTYGLSMDSMSHGDTSYVCPEGETFSVISAGTSENPSFLIGENCVRLDGVDDWYSGNFSSQLNEISVFSLFDVLGTTASTDRVLSLAESSSTDTNGKSIIPALNLSGQTAAYHSSGSNSHADPYGGITLLETHATDSTLNSKVDGGDELDRAITATLQLDRFGIGGEADGVSSATRSAIQLRFIAISPAILDVGDRDKIREHLQQTRITG